MYILHTMYNIYVYSVHTVPVHVHLKLHVHVPGNLTLKFFFFFQYNLFRVRGMINRILCTNRTCTVINEYINK